MPYLAVIAICYSDNLITGVYQILHLMKIKSKRLFEHTNWKKQSCRKTNQEDCESEEKENFSNKIKLFFVSIAFLLQAGSVIFAGIFGIEFLDKINLEDWMIGARGPILMLFLVASSGRHWMTYLPEVSKTSSDANKKKQRDAMAGLDVISGPETPEFLKLSAFLFLL